MTFDLVVRSMKASDAAAVAALLPDLGYEATEMQLEQRFAHVLGRPDNEVLVADAHGEIVGWAHVYGVRLLESDGYAEIGGVVVASSRQRKGIGTALISAAQQCAATMGYSRMRLRSGVHRESAHQFYEALGYTKSRASFAFERQIP